MKVTDFGNMKKTQAVKVIGVISVGYHLDGTVLNGNILKPNAQHYGVCQPMQTAS
ncbi:hypothetical protein KVQ82_13895 [Pseudomonas sp. AO-1]|uniref:hypothetical protein n=1 Tax=Pseudomonas sp. AO-1 TaxID=2855434 RepID=UPI001C77664E|nr:hypothetical protein [Pseudomonas sp. AO-1]QXZ16938.1 hypothetical protein KVQ82_13895 [Pseudomonas sp. AO-1]